jgi:hypothetical protein
MREIMIQEIQHYFWVDYRFRKMTLSEFVAHLQSLDDKDLLSVYNDLREVIENLD